MLTIGATDVKLIEKLLEPYIFTAKEIVEDNIVVLSLDEIDLVEYGANKQEAILNMAKGILEYAEDFYEDIDYWAVGKRKDHIPYVFKALMLNDVNKIGGLIKCHPGKI